jgi:hypothetical protein
MDTKKIPKHLYIGIHLRANRHHWKMLNCTLPSSQHILKAPEYQSNFGDGRRAPHVVGNLGHQRNSIRSTTNSRLNSIREHGFELTSTKLERCLEIGVEKQKHGHDVEKEQSRIRFHKRLK